MSTQRQIIVGITGASGAAYAQRIIQCALDADVHVHLVVSPLGQRLLHDELAMEGINLETLSGRDMIDGKVEGITHYNYRDVGATLASGSFKHDGMVIVPCSSNSLSAVATGSSQNLIHRAAQVALKERRKLVLVHREMPVSLVDIRNMAAATEAGAIVAPANPGFYLLPQSLDDIIDFVAGRVLDLLAIEHDLNIRWGENEPSGTESTD